jgi:hypothetical protein
MRTLIAIVGLAAFLEASQYTIPVHLSVSKEKPLAIRLVIDQDSVVVPRGTPDRETRRLLLELGLESRERSVEGLNIIRATILRLGREGVTGKVDTAHPDPKDPPDAAFMKALVGEKVDVEVGSDGAIKNLRGLDELEKHFVGKMGLKADSKGSQQKLKENLGAQLKDGLRPLFAVYPGRAIGIGPEWTTKYSVASENGAYHSECKWTLSGQKDARNRISGKWTLTEFPDADTKGRELTLVQKLKGTGEGTLELDAETGFPLEGTMTHHLSGTTFLDGLKAHFESDTFEVTYTIRFKVEKWDAK